MYGFSTALRALRIVPSPLKFRPCLLLSTLFALAALPLCARAEGEETFPVLTIGARTYTNVTVTTKSKSYVMLMHSTGLANIKVSELSPDVRETLGYSREEAPKTKAAAATKWAKAKLGAFNIGDVQAAEKNLREKWAQQSAAYHLPPLPEFNQRFVMIAAGVLFGLYLIFSALLRCIVQNAGKQPGALIWVPLLQIFPALKAASMSPAWILVFPLGIIVWCFKIAAACGKSPLTGLSLLFPLTSPLALLYLAFSGGRPAPEARTSSRPQLLALETA